MDKRKLMIILSGIGIVLFSFFSMQWLSGMKKHHPENHRKRLYNMKKH